jgi:hypothetical protein
MDLYYSRQDSVFCSSGIIIANLLFQRIYQEETQKISVEARAEIEKDLATKAMQRARSKTVPSSPNTFDELISQLEDPSTSEEFREMYLGNVQRNIRGKMIVMSKSNGC